MRRPRSPNAIRAAWTRRDALAALAFAPFALLAACRKSDSPRRPSAAPLGLDPQANLRISQGDRCPMCAMDVLANKTWAASVELDDGTTWYTCSARCAFGSALKSEQFLGVPALRIRRVRVPDYLHPDRTLDANAAFYVVGSDVRGPMGSALVATPSEQEANLVVQRHGGRILRRADITLALLSDLKKHAVAPAPGSS